MVVVAVAALHAAGTGGADATTQPPTSPTETCDKAVNSRRTYADLVAVPRKMNTAPEEGKHVAEAIGQTPRGLAGWLAVKKTGFSG